MPDSIETVQAEIVSELGKLGYLIDEGARLQIQITQLTSKLFALVLPRWDYEVLRGMADEFGLMAQIHKDEDAATELIEDISNRSAEANVRFQLEPDKLAKALAEILQMSKEARASKEASIKKLREIQARLEGLLDQATPKA